jgi:diadenylate cyclase
VLILIKGTRAMQMLTGLGIMGVAFLLSTSFELFTTRWMLSYFFDHLILIVIVLFQDDLRRALTTVGKNPFFQNVSAEEERVLVDDLARVARRLADQNTGALIVLEMETGLKDFTDTGSTIDAEFKPELLYSLFLHDSPLHDGAVIISNGRIAAAGCFLPLTREHGLDQKFGTRHRAAIGLTESTDSIVIVVSEESGSVSIATAGRLLEDLDDENVRARLFELIGVSHRRRRPRLRDMFRRPDA